MNKKELLATAREKYPIGTDYKSADDSIPATVGGTFQYYKQDDTVTDGHGGYVHYKGKWAEVTEYPEGYILETYKIY